MAVKKKSKAVSGNKKNTGKKKNSRKEPVKSRMEAEITIFHKPNCSTSRSVLELIKKKKMAVEIVKYIDHPPTEKELEKLLAKLNMKPFELIRTKEPYFKEKLMGLKLNDHEWIREMVENPVLIERPVLIKGNKAIIGRPIERVIDFLK